MTYSIDLASIAKNFGNEGNIIGYANKFYTLWSYKITENVETHELTFDVYFIKNIGLVNRFADIYPFDECLKGKEVHINSDVKGSGLQITKLELKALKFSKNPCRGALISEFTDLNTLCWKYNCCIVKGSIDKSQKEAELTNMLNRAIELGAVEFKDRLYSPDKQKEYWFIEMVSLNKQLENNEPLIITPNTNISVDGWLWIHKNKFYFEHKYYSWTYYGPEHSFPIDSNGKAKQIKNHKIEITNYEKTGDNEYKVISWEFVK